jgi:hypothetical protein
MIPLLPPHCMYAAFTALPLHDTLLLLHCMYAVSHHYLCMICMIPLQPLHCMYAVFTALHRFMYKLYRHKLYRHNLYRHKLYRHKLYREHIVSGTNCIGNKLFREQTVSGTYCIGNKLYRQVQVSKELAARLQQGEVLTLRSLSKFIVFLISLFFLLPSYLLYSTYVLMPIRIRIRISMMNSDWLQNDADHV